ncbi:MAG: inositol monophosphatase family protein [Sumerlaeia bacterium]
MLSTQDSQSLLAQLSALCRAAAEVHLQYWRALKSVEKKGDIDLVTVADKESEAVIVSLIQQWFPDHGILGEEGGVLGGQSDYRWIIDPIDGTTNFAHGLPIFSCSIGLEHRGTMIAGAVYAPVLDELYLASLGNGTTRNGEKVHVSQNENLIDGIIVTGFPYNRSEILPWILGNMGRFIGETRGVIRYGSAAYDLACIAAGYTDAFYEANLKPWDVAAGSLLVTEAGGRLSDFSGNGFNVHGREIVASNGGIHPVVLGILAEHAHLLPQHTQP